MSITVSFVVTVALILAAGVVFRRVDRSRNLRFTDEAGSTVSTLALARVEARRLALHPTFLSALGFVAVVSGLLVATEHDATVEADAVQFFIFIGVPVGALALIVAAHRNTTRARRDGADELFSSTPTSPRARTTAMLLACLGPVVIALAYLLLARTAIEWMLDAPQPPLWSQVGALAASMVLAVIGGGIVGVFLGRWLPITAAALVGVVAVIWLNNGPGNHDPRFRWLRVAVEKDLGGRFDIVPSAWLRLAFLGGLLALGACLALWSHTGRRSLVAATSVAVAVVLASGWVMSRPPSAAEVASAVDELEHPIRHQTCVDRDGVRYCAYPEATAWVDVWEPAVAGVLAAVPSEHRPSQVEVVQREAVANLAAPTEYNGDTAFPYMDEVVASLDPEVAWAADGRLHPALQLNDDQPDLDVAFQAAALAVGLPPSTSWDHPAGCRAGGQARVVLAMWLAGQATERARAGVAAHAARVGTESLEWNDVSFDTVTDYEEDSASTTGFYPVVGASGYGSDVLVARALLGVDQDRVRSAVASHWDELVAPTTPTARLVGLAGVSAADGSGDAVPAVAVGDPGACP